MNKLRVFLFFLVDIAYPLPLLRYTSVTFLMTSAHLLAPCVYADVLILNELCDGKHGEVFNVA